VAREQAGQTLEDVPALVIEGLKGSDSLTRRSRNQTGTDSVEDAGPDC
jgi:hypothetical protein